MYKIHFAVNIPFIDVFVLYNNTRVAARGTCHYTWDTLRLEPATEGLGRVLRLAEEPRKEETLPHPAQYFADIKTVKKSR